MNLTRDILRNRHRLSERQIDDFLGEQTQKERSLDRLMDMKQIGSFLKITKYLQNHRIDFINLKGPLLSQRIYGDPTYRYSRDFDILVEPNQVTQTLELLLDKEYSFPGFKWPESKIKQELALHFLNQIEIVHEETGQMIEVHWKLFSTRISDQKIIDRFIQEETETIVFGGVELKRLSNEFELFYLIVHGGVHAWFRLKWLVDIHEILDRYTVNWDKFHRIVSSCNAQKIVSICNVMLQEYFPEGTRIPIISQSPKNLGNIALQQCRRPSDDPSSSLANTIKLLFYRSKLFPSARYKFDVLKVLTFYKFDLKYNWLPPYKFIYYLFRPFGYLFRSIGILK